MPIAEPRSEGTVIVLTALEVEYEAVHRCLTDPMPHIHRAGTRFEVGAVPGGTCKVALGLVGKGNQSAAVLAERAISEFEPVAVVFVGVAGGLRSHIALGDVVVATHVYAYHGGTSSDGQLSARPRAWEAPHHLDQLARHVVRTGAWSGQFARNPLSPSPKVHFAPIAAGEVVLQSQISREAQWISQHYNDAAAIEMEGAGVAQAGHLRGTPTLVIRGISDFATKDKVNTDRAGWQLMAADRAAAFALALIAQIPGSGGETETRGPSKHTPKVEEMSARFANTVMDQGTVGFQIGQVVGGLQVGTGISTADRTTSELADLRKALDDAWNNGQLDSETYSAAKDELQNADACIPATTEKQRSKLVIALRRLKGLVEHVTTLAVKLATILDGLR